MDDVTDEVKGIDCVVFVGGLGLNAPKVKEYWLGKPDKVKVLLGQLDMEEPAMVGVRT